MAHNNKLRASEPVEGAADEHVRVHLRAPVAALRHAGCRPGQAASLQRGLGRRQHAAGESAAAIRRADQRAAPAAKVLGNAVGAQHPLLHAGHYHTTVHFLCLQPSAERFPAHADHLLLLCRLRGHFLH